MFVFTYVYISQKYNETAVWIASKEGHLEVVKALIAAGADLSIASVSTILFFLSFSSFRPFEVVWVVIVS